LATPSYQRRINSSLIARSSSGYTPLIVDGDDAMTANRRRRPRLSPHGVPDATLGAYI
jgi:hypothetical protein